MNDFDDLQSDDLDALVAAKADVTLYRSACKKCGGSGVWRGPGDCTGDRSCTECKGQGFHEYKRSDQERHAARERRHARKERVVQSRQEQVASKRSAWEAQYPAEAQWITSARSRSSFAQAMHDTLNTFGDLSPNKLAAVQRIVAEDAAKQAAAKAAIAAAPVVNLTQIEAAFAKASTMLQRPKLRVAGYIFSKAPAGGRNAGSLYVKRCASGDQEQEYLGKITEGRFVASRDATPEDVKQVQEVAASPREAAEKYGRLTGNCGVCGRSLLRESSVRQGMGDTCASRFGF